MSATIIRMSKRIMLDATGTLQNVYRCDFKSAKGAVSYVDVPQTSTDAEIRKAVEEEAAKMDRLLG